MIPQLSAHCEGGGKVDRTTPGSWHLSIPGGPAGQYRVAQLDDYQRLARRAFRWQAPLRLALRARASAPSLAGTWGFGLWNDPFTLSLGLGGMARRLPALPNAAWFFHASPPNQLSFHDAHPAQGFLAATFASPLLPAPLLALGAPALPLLAWAPTARLVRRLLARLVHEDAALVPDDQDAWHTYELELLPHSVTMLVDGGVRLRTHAAPRGRLGLVLWIDNQFAAFPADGHLATGSLATPAPAWLEIADVNVTEASAN